jgi:HlyD family secretion protein
VFLSPQPTTCQAAITEVMSVQAGIAGAEQSLANSEADLSTLLSKVIAAVEKSAGSGSSGGTVGSGSGKGSGGAGSSGGTGAGGASGGSRGAATGAAAGAPATAAQLAADQASLDAANAQLSVAHQDLAAATLVAPITGTVAQVNITPGQQVTGSQGSGSQGSGSTANLIIEGAGGQEATTTVTSTDVGKVRVGQPATITMDGSATSISGEVVAIGMLSATSSTGDVTYPVTIGLAAGAPTLFAGSDAQVAITLAEVDNAVTVPTSAIEGIGAATFVTVLRAGKPVTVRVVVGATGPALTQISSGLTVGQQVVLADMSTPLPTNTNPFAARGLTTGGGGFGGVRIGSVTTGGGKSGG